MCSWRGGVSANARGYDAGLRSNCSFPGQQRYIKACSGAVNLSVAFLNAILLQIIVLTPITTISIVFYAVVTERDRCEGNAIIDYFFYACGQIPAQGYQRNGPIKIDMKKATPVLIIFLILMAGMVRAQQKGNIFHDIHFVQSDKRVQNGLRREQCR